MTNLSIAVYVQPILRIYRLSLYIITQLLVLLSTGELKKNFFCVSGEFDWLFLSYFAHDSTKSKLILAFDRS